MLGSHGLRRKADLAGILPKKESIPDQTSEVLPIGVGMETVVDQAPPCGLLFVGVPVKDLVKTLTHVGKAVTIFGIAELIDVNSRVLVIPQGGGFGILESGANGDDFEPQLYKTPSGTPSCWDTSLTVTPSMIIIFTASCLNSVV